MIEYMDAEQAVIFLLLWRGGVEASIEMGWQSFHEKHSKFLVYGGLPACFKREIYDFSRL